MIYQRLIDTCDKDIPFLNALYQTPEISRYISIDETNFWRYVTANEHVFYYKVYDTERLVASIHCELCDETLHLAVAVVPDDHQNGIGTAIVRDIQSGVLPLSYQKIEVSIDEINIASIRLFEKAGFRFVAKEDELLTYVYEKQKRGSSP